MISTCQNIDKHAYSSCKALAMACSRLCITLKAATPCTVTCSKGYS